MRPPDASALIDGAAALGVALNDQQVDRLLAYRALISKWNRVYNLTAVRDPADMLYQHLLDSIAVIAPLRRQIADRPARLLDVGSGAGLPGVVLATLLRTIDVTCVDAVSKKASFVRQVAAELQLSNLHAAHQRVEAYEAEAFDVITSRAFASLSEFTSLTRRHQRHGTVWMAMKGKLPEAEMAALPSDIEVFHVEQLDVPGLAAERCLVWMRAFH